MPVHAPLDTWLAAYPDCHRQARRRWIHGSGIVLVWAGLLGLFQPISFVLADGSTLPVSLAAVMTVTVYAALLTLPLALGSGALLSTLLILWVLWDRAGGNTAIPAGLLTLAGTLFLTVGQTPEHGAGQRLLHAVRAVNELPRGLFWLLTHSARRAHRSMGEPVIK